MTFKVGVPKKLKLCVANFCLVVEIMANRYTKCKDTLRTCYACGSDNTYVCKNGIHTWLLNEPTDLMLCKTCYNEYIYRPKLKARGYYRRLVNFKGKEILLKTNPRKGFCQRCEKTGYTHLHHEYDIDILKHTIELCPSCHARESWRLGQMVVTKSKRKQGMEK